MKTYQIPNSVPQSCMRRQAGFSLMEAMISLALSTVVVAGMVALMGNSMGTATRLTEMTQLTSELRNVMSMLTRDVRRADYVADAALTCYGNPTCPATMLADSLTIVGNQCISYDWDYDKDSDKTDDTPGGFRLSGSVIEMYVGGWVEDPCGTDANWLPVTDPNVVQITTFNVSDAQSFSGSATVGATTLTQTVRQLNVVIEGRLVLDQGITRRIEDVIRVRNDVFL